MKSSTYKNSGLVGITIEDHALDCERSISLNHIDKHAFDLHLKRVHLLDAHADAIGSIQNGREARTLLVRIDRCDVRIGQLTR